MFPYFDVLFEKLKQNDKTARDAFGEHVHWGFWNNPPTDRISPKDYNRAGELMVQHIVSAATIRDNSTILDVGCGFGGTIKFLNEKFHNCNLWGVNIDERQLKKARNITVPMNGNAIEYINADACTLPFYERKFDVIICVESIFHFDNRKEFFRECQRVLRPGGILVISDFVPIRIASSLLNYLENTFNLVKKTYGTVHLDISIQQYKKIAKKYGFNLSSIDNITNHTLPTYTFLKDNFHIISEVKKFRRSTRFIEYASKMGILQYLIMSFRKLPQ